MGKTGAVSNRTQTSAAAPTLTVVPQTDAVTSAAAVEPSGPTPPTATQLRATQGADPQGPAPAAGGTVNPALKALTDQVNNLRLAVTFYTNDAGTLHGDIKTCIAAFQTLAAQWPTKEELSAAIPDPNVRRMLGDAYLSLSEERDNLIDTLASLHTADRRLSVTFTEYAATFNKNDQPGQAPTTKGYYDDLRLAAYDGDSPRKLAEKKAAQSRLDGKISFTQFVLPLNATLESTLTGLQDVTELRRIEAPWLARQNPALTDKQVKEAVAQRIRDLNPDVDWTNPQHDPVSIIVPHEYASFVTSARRPVQHDIRTVGAGETMKKYSQAAANDMYKTYATALSLLGPKVNFVLQAIPAALEAGTNLPPETVKKIRAFQQLAKLGEALSKDDSVKKGLEELKKEPMSSTMRKLTFIGMILLDLTVIGLLVMNLLNALGAIKIPKVSSGVLTAMFDITVTFASSQNYKDAIAATKMKAATDIDAGFQLALKAGQSATKASGKGSSGDSGDASGDAGGSGGGGKGGDGSGGGGSGGGKGGCGSGGGKGG